MSEITFENFLICTFTTAMKLISVTILLICLTAATFSKWILIACYDLNENYVANELCLNKNNPASHCNGHCYLSRQLNNDEKPNTPINNASKEKFEIQLFFIENTDKHFTPSSFIAAQYNIDQQFCLQQVINSCFHPPAV